LLFVIEAYILINNFSSPSPSPPIPSPSSSFTSISILFFHCSISQSLSLPPLHYPLLSSSSISLPLFSQSLFSSSSLHDRVSAEDALNARDLAVQRRCAEVNNARVAHIKKWQAEYTKHQQVRIGPKRNSELSFPVISLFITLFIFLLRSAPSLPLPLYSPLFQCHPVVLSPLPLSDSNPSPPSPQPPLSSVTSSPFLTLATLPSHSLPAGPHAGGAQDPHREGRVLCHVHCH
jgi:hypothetical protein